MNEDYNIYHNNQTDYHMPEQDDGQKHRKKKSGVGRVAAITLGMLVLIGVAAAGGYSAHTVVDQLTSGRQEETSPAETQSGQKENGASLNRDTSEADSKNNTPIQQQATTAVSQGQTSSVILTDVSNVVDAVMPSVVSIVNTGIYTTQGGFGSFWEREITEIPTESSGSGIIIGQNDNELLIVTNNHVVADNDSLTVQFVDDSTAAAEVKGTKASSDIAIISVPLDQLSEETKNAIRIATLGDSDNLRIGQGVIAIGNALGYGQSTTEGIISALNREVTTSEGTTLTVLQTSAPINPGNSGGALLNASGEVIGINTAKVMDTKVEGINYAIPISSVIDLIQNMMDWETRGRVSEEDASYLGIQPIAVDKKSAAAYDMPVGVYAYVVVEGSPAAVAGMQEKDIITHLDQYPIESVEELQTALGYFSGGDTVTVTIARLVNGSYQEMDLEITLAYKRDQAN